MKFGYWAELALYLFLAVVVFVPAFAQTFNSGSTGKDGALTYATPGNYVFNPRTQFPLWMSTATASTTSRRSRLVQG